MHKQAIRFAIFMAVPAVNVVAQTTVTSSGATATVGNVPYVSAATDQTTTLGPSSILYNQSNGVVNVTGNANVYGYLTINGVTEQFQEDTGRRGSAALRLTSTQPNWRAALTLMPSGTYNESDLRLYNGSDPSNVGAVENSIQGATYYTTGELFGNGTQPTAYIIQNMNVGIGTTAAASLFSVGASSQFQVNSSGGVTSGSIVSSGPVGIGTSPQYTLDVAGQIHASQAIYASGGVTFADGSTLNSASTLCGGDYAESVDVTGIRARYEPGDVLALDTAHPGKFLKSNVPYSTVIAGIYSTKPGAIGRRQTTPRSPDEVPMAMIGIVPVKVTAENGPIYAGDLLVSSSIPGRAMKGTDRSRMLGAVIGKSMGTLDSGSGVIEMLVTLQ